MIENQFCNQAVLLLLLVLFGCSNFEEPFRPEIVEFQIVDLPIYLGKVESKQDSLLSGRLFSGNEYSDLFDNGIFGFYEVGPMEIDLVDRELLAYLEIYSFKSIIIRCDLYFLNLRPKELEATSEYFKYSLPKVESFKSKVRIDTQRIRKVNSVEKDYLISVGYLFADSLIAEGRKEFWLRIK